MNTVVSELGSIKRSAGFINTNFAHLDFWLCDYRHDANDIKQNQDTKLLYDVIKRVLCCGGSTFSTYKIESLIAQIYGVPFDLQERPKKEGESGSIDFTYNEKLRQYYNEFCDFGEHWDGKIDEIPLDPENPKNERRLLKLLVKSFGTGIVNFIYTQVAIDRVLPTDKAKNFLSQRLDFLLSFPNGKSLIIEPGDHDDPMQQAKDNQRDEEFKAIGIKTLRPRNADLDNNDLPEQIRQELKLIDAMPFLQVKKKRNGDELAANYLFLLPSLIARIESVLAFYLLKRNFIASSNFSIGILERDMVCADLEGEDKKDCVKGTGFPLPQ